jgi:3-deoxy-D-manno-octulosonate 8-phosphate phosphatase (KDO 8-P phosphatase)
VKARENKRVGVAGEKKKRAVHDDASKSSVSRRAKSIRADASTPRSSSTDVAANRSPRRARAAPRSRSSRAGGDFAVRLASVRLLALDVDGVLTDGSIAYGAHRDQIQRFDVQDGLALRWLAQAGVKIAWITGRGCMANVHRARELEIDELFERVPSKSAVLCELQRRHSISVAETAAMGDDFPDLSLRAHAGFFAAPANAVDDVKARADLVTRASGGRGAVRELAEAILRAKGRWQAILDAALR